MTTQFNFVSYVTLVDHVADWSLTLPKDIVAIAGVPRSGLLPAVQLALHRNIYLATFDELRANRKPWRKTGRRRQARADGRVLILDDSCNTGSALDAARVSLKKCQSDLVFGAMYANDPNTEGLDLFYRHLPKPRIFQWNLFHNKQTRKTCFDLDGVLCVDPVFQEEDNGPNAIFWQRHLLNATPNFIPTQWVRAVVSSRLEKYREQTKQWLADHNVCYQNLILSPHETASARREAHDHAHRKAEFYSCDNISTLFIESNVKQAAQIADLSGKPVICSDTMTIFQGTPTGDPE